MNYYGAKELAEGFRTVRKNTIQVAEDIPEDKYSFRAALDTMSVGEILAHLADRHALGRPVPFRPEEVECCDGRLRCLDAGGWSAFEGARHQGADPDALKNDGESFAKCLDSMGEAELAQTVALPGRQQVTLRDAARRQGARDASPCPAVPRRAHGRHRPAPHPRASGASGGDGRASQGVGKYRHGNTESRKHRKPFGEDQRGSLRFCASCSWFRVSVFAF